MAAAVDSVYGPYSGKVNRLNLATKIETGCTRGFMHPCTFVLEPRYGTYTGAGIVRMTTVVVVTSVGFHAGGEVILGRADLVQYRIIKHPHEVVAKNCF